MSGTHAGGGHADMLLRLYYAVQGLVPCCMLPAPHGVSEPCGPELGQERWGEHALPGFCCFCFFPLPRRTQNRAREREADRQTSPRARAGTDTAQRAAGRRQRARSPALRGWAVRPSAQRARELER